MFEYLLSAKQIQIRGLWHRKSGVQIITKNGKNRLAYTMANPQTESWWYWAFVSVGDVREYSSADLLEYHSIKPSDMFLVRTDDEQIAQLLQLTPAQYTRWLRERTNKPAAIE